MSAPSERIPVRTPTASYDVLVGEGLLNDLGRIARDIGLGRRVVLVADAGLPPELPQRAAAALVEAGYALHLESIESGESHKTLSTVERLCRGFASFALERTDGVMALGGGVVGDVAGFAAAVYRRGCAVVQCPTTLLAMVDASVGGKTGVNLAAEGGQIRKNFVGAFHHPAAVIADVSTLASLPKRDLRSGAAECVKHGLIARTALGKHGERFARDQSHDLPEALAGDHAAAVRTVARNVALKAAVVANDERETAGTGGRALLNLGHTFAHVIEPMPGCDAGTGPGPLQHGEAVGLGLVAASACSVSLGLAPASFVDDVRGAVSGAGLPVCVRGLPPAEKLVAAMAHDKKAIGGRLRVIAPTRGGEARVVESPDPSSLSTGWAAITA